ncbi:dynein regulatory complex protein 1-like [Hemibagrus wyckioides]|uniref:dynein regulatory complex protein 1-like n=1 Tax=Hemibagrus wyckioides TaxID=337641 RepID=UPI00266CF26A|nr:dynein regulatory complex protein 1-like [Hemibagrus wyckioides]
MFLESNKMLPSRVLLKKKAEAGPSAETRIEARRKRVAARVQARKRQAVGDDVQKKEDALPFQRQMEQSERHMTKLKADGTELVTNILVAADARELKRREKLREANRLRLEKLENEVKSSTEKFNKIMNKLTEAKTMNIPQKLKDELRRQQQLCWQIIEDKDKLISELQQELKAKQARFVKDRKREAEEVDLLIERMQEQISSLKKDYRKELDLIERSFNDEWTDLLTNSKKEWEQQRKERSDKEVEFLLERMKTLEDHESLLNRLRLQSAEEYNKLRIKLESDVQHLEQDLQERKASYQFEQEKHEYNKQMLKKYEEEYAVTYAQQMRKITRLHDMRNNLKKKCADQYKQSREEIQSRIKKYNRLTQQYKDIYRRKRHFEEVDTKHYKEIWLMKEDEAKALACRAVDLDRVIHEQVLGLTWSPPTLPFMDHSSPNTHTHFTDRETTQAKESGIERMNDSEVKAYWENIANIIPESKLKVWRDLKAGLRKYHTELTKRSKLLTETHQLKQQNSELRMLLHKYQNSKVRAKQRIPHMQMHKHIN